MAPPAGVTSARGSAMPARFASALDLRSLEIFIAVVECEGMTGAARRLGISQPAVSLAITHLEEALQGLLLDRSTRPVRPTPAGSVLLRRARGILADARQLRDSVSQAGERPLPGIRIGLVASITALGAPLIVALQALADDLRIWSTLTPDLAAALRERKLDVLVTSEALDDMRDVERRAVIREPFAFAVPHEVATARRNPTLPMLAKSLPFIRYTSRSSIGTVIERYLKRRGVVPPRHLELDSSVAVLDMVAAGLGWAMTTPLCLIQSGVPLDSIALHPIDGAPFGRALYVIARRGELPGAVDRIGDVVAALARDLMSQRLRGRNGWLMNDVAFG